jgi:hypothetical protein
MHASKRKRLTVLQVIIFFFDLISCRFNRVLVFLASDLNLDWQRNSRGPLLMGLYMETQERACESRIFQKSEAR